MSITVAPVETRINVSFQIVGKLLHLVFDTSVGAP